MERENFRGLSTCAKRRDNRGRRIPYSSRGQRCRFRVFSREADMSTIHLKTSIPGPKSQALSARRAQALPRGLSHGTPIYVAKAEDAWLEDVDGNRYLDFAGGIGCANAGHRQQRVVDAISAQLDKFLHTCVQVTPYEGYIRL